MKELTHEEKVGLYHKGQYAFAVPPVCHLRWDVTDWVRYIDSCGKWLPTKEDQHEDR